jgi:hypothetical protein
VLQIGDASGIQSPLSFGGFGALSRHLARLTRALTDALAADALSRRELRLINAYNPGLSSAWMLQRAMTGSRRPGPGPLGAAAAGGTGAGAAAGGGSGGEPAPDLINRMLSSNFGSMVGLGDPVLKPFLQVCVCVFWGGGGRCGVCVCVCVGVFRGGGASGAGQPWLRSQARATACSAPRDISKCLVLRCLHLLCWHGRYCRRT